MEGVHFLTLVNYCCVTVRVNQALQFDGVDDHVTLPSIHNLGLTDRYFISRSYLLVLR